MALFQSLHVAPRRGVEQFLERSAIFQTTLNFGDQKFGYIEGEAPALETAGKDPAGMLFSTRTSTAVLTDAPAAAQAERTESGGPEGGGMGLKPMLDIGKRLRFAGHVVYMPYRIFTRLHAYAHVYKRILLERKWCLLMWNP